MADTRSLDHSSHERESWSGSAGPPLGGGGCSILTWAPYL